jgi:hypothetical protein
MLTHAHTRVKQGDLKMDYTKAVYLLSQESYRMAAAIRSLPFLETSEASVCIFLWNT